MTGNLCCCGAYSNIHKAGRQAIGNEQVHVYTNTDPASAFRAPGYVEGAFALESAMDELARALEMDPLELRLRNHATGDQLSGKPYTTDGLRACYERASEAFAWRAYRRPEPRGSGYRGAGMAANIWRGGGGFAPAYAWVELNGAGSADVITSTQDIGTGIRTGLAQVADDLSEGDGSSDLGLCARRGRGRVATRGARGAGGATRPERRRQRAASTVGGGRGPPRRRNWPRAD